MKVKGFNYFLFANANEDVRFYLGHRVRKHRRAQRRDLNERYR